MNIPETCQAAVHRSAARQLTLEQVPVPRELEPGSILVRTRLASVCATDVHLWGRESPQPDAPMPVILGHEAIGEVARRGEGANHDALGAALSVGDRVVWTYGSCGQCYCCTVAQQPTRCPNWRGYMTRRCDEYPYLTGAFAEYCYVSPTSRRVKVPDEVTDELASAASCAFYTVIHGFERLGPVDDRHTVLIQGSGPLGLFATALAAKQGARKIIVIGGPARRLEIARAWGADHTIDIELAPDAAERAGRVLEWTDGLGPEVVVEVSGVPAAFAEGLNLAQIGGRYLVLGQLHQELVPIPPAILVGKQLAVLGCVAGEARHLYRALEFIRTNSERFDWSLLTSGHYRLDQINQALENMRLWKEVKPAITF